MKAPVATRYPSPISAGVAQFKNSIHTPAQLIGVADRRLLDAKRAGRNRTVASSASDVAADLQARSM